MAWRMMTPEKIVTMVSPEQPAGGEVQGDPLFLGAAQPGGLSGCRWVAEWSATLRSSTSG
jgi:hypothetical protein